MGEPEQIKVAVVGASGVGKTSLIRVLTRGKVPTLDKPWAALSYSGKTIVLWDATIGDEYEAYHEADVILMCFAVDDGNSAAFLSELHQSTLCDLRNRSEVVLLGLKRELRKQEGVATIVRSELDTFAKHLVAVDYIECSAKTKKKLTKLVDTILDAKELVAMNREAMENTQMLEKIEYLEKFFVRYLPNDEYEELLAEIADTEGATDPFDVLGCVLNMLEEYRAVDGVNDKASARDLFEYLIPDDSPVVDDHSSPIMGYNEYNILALAAGVGDIALINHLVQERELDVNAVPNTGVYPLLYAVYKGNFESAEHLIALCGAETDIPTPEGISLLDVARSMEEVNPEIVALLSDGVDDDAPVLKRDLGPISVGRSRFKTPERTEKVRIKFGKEGKVARPGRDSVFMHDPVTLEDIEVPLPTKGRKFSVSVNLPDDRSLMDDLAQDPTYGNDEIDITSPIAHRDEVDEQLDIAARNKAQNAAAAAAAAEAEADALEADPAPVDPAPEVVPPPAVAATAVVDTPPADTAEPEDPPALPPKRPGKRSVGFGSDVKDNDGSTGASSPPPEAESAPPVPPKSSNRPARTKSKSGPRPKAKSKTRPKAKAKKTRPPPKGKVRTKRGNSRAKRPPITRLSPKVNSAPANPVAHPEVASATTAAATAATDAATGTTTTERAASPATVVPAPEVNNKYTYEELLTRPADVDPLSQELFLRDDEFVKVFGIERRVFEGLPLWKQRRRKREVQLF